MDGKIRSSRKAAPLLAVLALLLSACAVAPVEAAPGYAYGYPGPYYDDGYPYPVTGAFDFDYGGWGRWHHGWDHGHGGHGFAGHAHVAGHGFHGGGGHRG